MVLLHIKRTDQNHFLYETRLNTKIGYLTPEIVIIINGRLKIHRIPAKINQFIKDPIGTLNERLPNAKMGEVLKKYQ